MAAQVGRKCALCEGLIPSQLVEIEIVYGANGARTLAMHSDCHIAWVAAHQMLRAGDDKLDDQPQHV